MESIRVLIADDHGGFADAARRFLTQAGYRVDQPCTRPEDLLPRAKHEKPEIILLEMAFATSRGSNVVEQLKKLEHSPVVIVVTKHEEEPYRALANELHADGFVPKSRFSETIVETIRRCQTNPRTPPEE